MVNNFGSNCSGLMYTVCTPRYINEFITSKNCVAEEHLPFKILDNNHQKWTIKVFYYCYSLINVQL